MWSLGRRDRFLPRPSLLNFLHPQCRLQPRPATIQQTIRRLHGSNPLRAPSYRHFGQQQNTPFNARFGSDLAARVRRTPPVVWIAASGGGVYYVYHLEKTETGRWRFMDVTEVSEREMGDAASQEIMSQYNGRFLPDNHPTTIYVRRIANRILSASGLDSSTHGKQGILQRTADSWDAVARKQGVDWKVRVIADDSIRNAFVLPNGAIFVFTGILPVCANEDGLAAVLGHEVAHQVARHAGEKMSSQKVYAALSWLALLLGIDAGITSPAIGLLLQLPNSRAAESEADRIGLKLASRACFKPGEAARMWERMQQAEGGSPQGLDFLSTHPANQKRIQQIKKWLPECEQIRQESCGEGASYSAAFTQATRTQLS